MYRSLLVPLDGSAFGEHALPPALSLARRLRATLGIVHVHMPLGGLYGEYGTSYDPTTDRALRDRDRAYLDAVVQRLAAITDAAPSAAMLDGPVADTISRHAAATGADLLIMTTQGRGPLTRFWLGSVADALVRQASIPILLVRPSEVAPDLSQEPLIRRVLIPLDGSELAEQILEPALSLGTAMQAEYTLLRVVEAVIPGDQIQAAAKVNESQEPLLWHLQALHRLEYGQAQDYLERLAERLRARSLTVQTRVVAHGQPAAAILDDARESAADLIALATQGRGGLKRLFLGSVADKVVRGAATPVLVCRPVDESDHAEK